jgi:hypothetical protein
MISIYTILLSSQMLLANNQISLLDYNEIALNQEIDNEPVIKVNPGPSGTGLISISTEETATAFVILNEFGAVLMIVPCTGTNTVVDISSLPKGAYFVKVFQSPQTEIIIKE